MSTFYNKELNRNFLLFEIDVCMYVGWRGGKSREDKDSNQGPYNILDSNQQGLTDRE